MNYRESKLILEEIKKAKRILVNCHRRPDIDSISSALAVYSALTELDKNLDIVCPSRLPIPSNYMNNFNNIRTVDFNKFNFDLYDLFIVLDSSTWDTVVGSKDIKRPKNLKIIKIDHHDTQEKFEDSSVIDNRASSTSELLYLIFKDWEIKISKNTATCLLSGIIADSVCFSIPLTSSKTFRIASELLDQDADKDLIMDRQFNSIEFNLLKFYGEALQRLQFDNPYEFAWSAIPNSIFMKLNKPIAAKNATANTFFSKVANSKFGILILEESPNVVEVSFRSAGKFDTSKIASSLGGGGHHDSSAAKVSGLTFKKAVEKILETARSIVKNEN